MTRFIAIILSALALSANAFAPVSLKTVVSFLCYYRMVHSFVSIHVLLCIRDKRYLKSLTQFIIIHSQSL